MKMKPDLNQYWNKNKKYLLILLTAWFMSSFGFAILFVDSLNEIRFAGFKLGFWFAQQGSILTFLLIIFIYVRLMNKLDKEYEVDEE